MSELKASRLGLSVGFRALLQTTRAKATLRTIETIRTIKNGHLSNKAPGVRGEISFVRDLFDQAA